MVRRHSGYGSSQEKDVVREYFDLPLLERFSSHKGTKLKYFGMPGAQCLDIGSWRNVLQEVTAVERHRRNLASMENRLNKHFAEIRSSAYHGDVDDIILAGHGNSRKIGGKAANIEVANDFDLTLDRRVWNFDVVYLDYFGPFLPQQSETYPEARARRDLALRHLFEQERLDARRSWVLLITVEGGQYPDNDAEHLFEFVETARRRANGDMLEALDFLLTPSVDCKGQATKLVHAAMAIFVASAAGNAKLLAKPGGTVSYLGSGGQEMVHSAFIFEQAPTFFGDFPDPLPLLRAPIIRPILVDRVPGFEWSNDPCPGTTKESVRNCLQFLDPGYLDPLLSGVAR